MSECSDLLTIYVGSQNRKSGHLTRPPRCYFFPTMDQEGGSGTELPASLRVLISNGSADRFAQVAETVEELGHEVLREPRLEALGATTRAEKPDLAIVVVHTSSPQVLVTIDRIVREAACPVIAILDVQDRTFINEAAKRGIFAYLTGGEDPAELQSSIDVVLKRFAEYHNLEGAFFRRAVTERAKGILMERHGIDEQGAFSMLREHARRSNRKIVDVAEALLESHLLGRQGSQVGRSAPKEEDSPLS